jgi:hypothetical protein
VNPLTGHCSTYYSYSFEQALAGLAVVPWAADVGLAAYGLS